MPTALKTNGLPIHIVTKYIPAANQVIAPVGLKILALSHTLAEGFYPGSLAYRTNNPGNIGTSTGPGHKPRIATLPTLVDGVQRQLGHISGIVAGTNKYYKGGGNLTLLQYLNIYAPPTDGNNVKNYADSVIQNFKKQGYNISPATTLNEISKIGGSADDEKKKFHKYGNTIGNFFDYFGRFIYGH